MWRRAVGIIIVVLSVVTLAALVNASHIADKGTRDMAISNLLCGWLLVVMLPFGILFTALRKSNPPAQQSVNFEFRETPAHRRTIETLDMGIAYLDHLIARVKAGDPEALDQAAKFADFVGTVGITGAQASAALNRTLAALDELKPPPAPPTQPFRVFGFEGNRQAEDDQ